MEPVIPQTKKQTRKATKRIIWTSIILIILATVFFFAPVMKHRVVAIGEILPVKQYIDMQAIGETHRDNLPTFYFTVVNTMNISTLNDYAYALLHYDEPEISPLVTVQSEFDLSFNDLQKRLHYSTLTSAQNLTLHALKQTGRHVPYTVKPTVIVVYDAFETGKVFHEGDRIVAIDEQPIETTMDFTDVIKSKDVQLGTTLLFEVERDGQLLDLPITYREKTKSGQPLIGILVQDIFEFDGIDPLKLLNFGGEIEGNSTGLMMALQLTQELSGRDLTHGYKIAGTGSLELDGSVGEIGAMTHKVKTAVANGVDIYFVPKSDSPMEMNEI